MNDPGTTGGKPTLEDVGARLKAAQDAAAAKVTREVEAGDSAQGVGVGFRIGIELIAGVLVGAGLGWFIDKKLETSPIFMLAFIALGFAASVLSVIRILKKLDQAVGLGRAVRDKQGREVDTTPPPSPKGFEDEDE